MSIRFAVRECWLGAVLVAATDKGICAILLGDDPITVVRDLHERFPDAQASGHDEPFERTVAAAVRFVDAPAYGLDVRFKRKRALLARESAWRAAS
jgi:AraC family transcriptional regulator, regulatory protein of adaptative response / methylated-DNA-[protein]-cysteine methyltransferase